jgi:hypothetical protein
MKTGLLQKEAINEKKQPNPVVYYLPEPIQQ